MGTTTHILVLFASFCWCGPRFRAGSLRKGVMYSPRTVLRPCRAKSDKDKKNIGNLRYESESGKVGELPDDFRKRLRSNAEKRLKEMAESKTDLMTKEGFVKFKENLKAETAEVLNASFDDAKEQVLLEFKSRMEEINKTRALMRERNEDLKERLRKEDEKELEKYYKRVIEPLKKDRDEMRKTVEEMRDIESNPERNQGLFFQQLYGPSSQRRKEKVIRPQSSEDGKIKFLEDNASSSKEVGKATKDAIEELKEKTKAQYEPFIRAAYALMASTLIINGVKWLSAHNPFQAPS
mmetsp:Transcript_20636/g.30880  ORF Transcript_20636/g.30880 Transcript_20636/m.30880 type:complete len:294 (+) Transcript_20636:1-882(+)